MSEENVNENVESTEESVPTDGTTTSVPETEEVKTVATEDWRSSLSEEFRGDDLLQNVKSMDDLAKGYIHAQKSMGGMIRIPTEDASDEAKAEFFKKLESIPGVVHMDEDNMTNVYDQLGRPEKAEEYKVEMDLDEGLIDSEKLGEFKEIAHNIGLNSKQLQKVLNFEQERVKNTVELSNLERESGETKLKEMWGNDYNNRLESAKATMNVFNEQFPEETQALINGPAGNNPVFLELLSRMGKSMQESGHPNLHTTVSFGVTPQEALDKIDEIMSNKSHAYFNATDPAHERAKEKVRFLYQQAYPEDK